MITGTRTAGPGYAAFTDAGLIPHTDGSSVPDPPGLLLLACQQPADGGGATLVADGARIIGTLASQHRDALAALCAPRAAFFGTAGGHLGPVCEPAGAQRTSLRFRLDDLAWFSSGATTAIPPPTHLRWWYPGGRTSHTGPTGSPTWASARQTTVRLRPPGPCQPRSGRP